MESTLKKCAKATFIKDLLESKQNIKIDESIIIKELDQELYKYLGIDKHVGIQLSNN